MNDIPCAVHVMIYVQITCESSYVGFLHKKGPLCKTSLMYQVIILQFIIPNPEWSHSLHVEDCSHYSMGRVSYYSSFILFEL